MTADPWDEVAKEADLLRGAIITGTLRAHHVELGPVDPRVGDTSAQRAARQRQAAARAVSRGHRRRNASALDEHLGTSPYPSAEMYRTGDPWSREPTEQEVRQAGNDLVAAGWPKDVVARLLGITPRS